MAALARKLGIPKHSAVGILEMLWHFTAEYAKDGNIGRYSDEEIAAAVEWQGDAKSLISALVETKWLDEESSLFSGAQPGAHHAHICVHDWAHHCDDGVHTFLARAGKLFADGSKPNLSRLSYSDRRRLNKKLRDVPTPCPQNAHAVQKKEQRPSPAQPSPAQPCLSPAKPSPSPATPSPQSGGLGSGGAGSGMGSGGLGREFRKELEGVTDEADASRMFMVQAKLKSVGVGQAAQVELMRRKDINRRLIEQELENIRASPNVEDIPGVLVHRLRNHRNGNGSPTTRGR
jgi:hypothetical protein